MFRSIVIFLFGGTITEAEHQTEQRAKWEKSLKDAERNKEDLMNLHDRNASRITQHLNEVDRIRKANADIAEKIGQARGAMKEAHYMLGLVDGKEPEPLSNTKLRGVTTMT